MLRKIQSNIIARNKALFNNASKAAGSGRFGVSKSAINFNNNNLFFNTKQRAVLRFYSSNNEQAETIEAEVMSEHVIEITAPEVRLTS